MATRQRRTPTQQQVVAATRMNPGAGGGRQAIVGPVPPTPGLQPVASRIEAWSWSSDGDIIASAVSDVYEVLIGGRYVDIVANLTSALAGDTDIDILVNGVAAATVTIASGTTREAATLALPLDPEDLVALESTAVGTGSARCTVQMKVES